MRYEVEVVRVPEQTLAVLGGRGAMSEIVPETLHGRIAVRLSRAGRKAETLYEDEGANAGLEAVGDLARLAV